MPSEIKLQIEIKAKMSFKFSNSIHFHIEPAKTQRPFPPCEVTRCLVASDEKCLELEDCDSEPNDSDVNQGNNDESSNARADADWIGMDRGLLDGDNSHDVIETQKISDGNIIFHATTIMPQSQLFLRK